MTMQAAPRRASGTVQMPSPRPTAGGGGNGAGGGDDEDTERHPFRGLVDLSTATILKIAIPSVTAILGLIVAAVHFHYDTRTHVKNKVIHLGTAERPLLETKAEAKKARAKMIKVIRVQLDVKHRELKVDQREQIQEIRADQQKILREIVRTRRAAER
jgi:hypothetical protein